MSKTIIGVKAFDQNWKCRDFQFEVGKTFTHDGEVSICNSGFHFCENPLDIFTYYPLTSKFALVEGGDTKQHSDDSKVVCKTITIKSEISLHLALKMGVDFILSKINWKDAPATNTGDYSAATNTGNYSAATNTGYQSAATNTGNRSAATNTGDKSAATNTGDKSAATNTGDKSAATNTGNCSAATNTGKDGVAISVGIEGKASATKGNFITLAEWEIIDNEWRRVDVQSVLVDGKEILADTFYQLKNGKFVKAE